MAMAIANLITESELSPEYVVSTQFDPRGVIGVVTPCTNPIVTPMCNAMFALKGRNSIIIAPHPRAKKCARSSRLCL